MIAGVSMGVVTAVAVLACGATYLSRQKKKQRQPYKAKAPALMASNGKIAWTGSTSPCETMEPDSPELHGCLGRRKMEAHSRPKGLTESCMHAREMHDNGRRIRLSGRDAARPIWRVSTRISAIRFILRLDLSSIVVLHFSSS